MSGKARTPSGCHAVPLAFLVVVLQGRNMVKPAERLGKVAGGRKAASKRDLRNRLVRHLEQQLRLADALLLDALGEHLASALAKQARKRAVGHVAKLRHIVHASTKEYPMVEWDTHRYNPKRIYFYSEQLVQLHYVSSMKCVKDL